MDFDEISEKAYKRQDLGEFKNIVEKYAYLQLLNLYRDYNNEMISKNDAIKKKNKIKKEYEWNLQELKKYYEVFKHQQDIRNEYFSYLTEIEKSKNNDDLLINSLKLIEIIIQDNSFFERNYKKIKNN